MAIALPLFRMSNRALISKNRSPFANGGGFERHDALLLKNNGLLTFHDEARANYERHIKIVDIAEYFLQGHYGTLAPNEPQHEDAVFVARLRQTVGEVAGFLVASRPLAASGTGLL